MNRTSEHGPLTIAVTGGRDASAYTMNLAKEIGRELISRGHTLINGGGKGVDQATVAGAELYLEQIGASPEGRMIALRPGESPIAHSSGYTEVHRRGKTYAERRDAVVVAADVIVILAGGKNTLDLAKRARNYRKPLLPIGCTGGTALEVWRELVADDGTIYVTRGMLPDEAIRALNPTSNPDAEEFAKSIMDLVDSLRYPIGTKQEGMAARTAEFEPAVRNLKLTAAEISHLRTKRAELNNRYGSLTRQIAALDTDIARTIEEIRLLSLKEMRLAREKERDETAAQIAGIETQLEL